MSHEEILRELAALPPEAQRQVAEFIISLRERYTHDQHPEKYETSDLAEENFVGMWRDREDLEDSSAWVRRSREREWIKQSG